jgi:hypothetical protein
MLFQKFLILKLLILQFSLIYYPNSFLFYSIGMRIIDI